MEIMASLGYDRYGAQGGDWGSVVTANAADLAPDHVVGLHLNFVVARSPEGDTAPLTEAELAHLEAMGEWRRTGAGYQEIQGTKPQTLGYGLEDSPAGLAAWIVEKFRAWSDCDGDIERSFTKDQLLANVTAYWATGTATSSARLYHEMRLAGRRALPHGYITTPTGVANFAGEVTRMPRSWVEAAYNIVHWSEIPPVGTSQRWRCRTSSSTTPAPSSARCARPEQPSNHTAGLRRPGATCPGANGIAPRISLHSPLGPKRPSRPPSVGARRARQPCSARRPRSPPTRRG